jgi:hypothetical protein
MCINFGGMDHHSCFDQLVAATEELIHENERVRAKFTAFEAALQEVVENQKALLRATRTNRGYPPHGSSSRRN